MRLNEDSRPLEVPRPESYRPLHEWLEYLPCAAFALHDEQLVEPRNDAARRLSSEAQPLDSLLKGWGIATPPSEWLTSTPNTPLVWTSIWGPVEARYLPGSPSLLLIAAQSLPPSELLQALEQLKDTLCIVGSDHRIRWTNPACADLLGLKIGEIYWQAFPESLHSCWQHALKRALQGEAFQMSLPTSLLQYRHHFRLMPLYVAGSPASVAIQSWDAQELQENIQQLAEMQIHMMMAASHLTLWKSDRQQRTAYFSPIWYEELGYTPPPEGIDNLDMWLARVHSEDLPKLRVALERYQAGEVDRYQCEYRVLDAHGQWRWRFDTGQSSSAGPDLLMGVSMDTTVRNTVEKALSASETRYQLLIEHAPMGIAVIASDGKIRSANPKLLELLGSPSLEATQNINTLIFPPMRQSGISADLERCMREQHSFSAEKLYTSHWGRTSWFRYHLAPLPLQGEDPGGLLALVEDVTHYKQVLDELSLAKERAEAASIAKSEFLAKMSHELRTPLNSVIGFTRLLLRQPLSETQLDYLRRIGSNGKHLLNLINELLDLARIEAGQMRLDIDTIFLLPLLREVIAQCEGQALERKLKLTLETPDTLPAIRADIARLRQILINLIGNAIKFTPQGHVALIAEMKADTLCIHVRDTGIGIAEHVLPHIFEPFRQGDDSSRRRFEGTGMGLAICHSLCEQMGFRLTISSQINQGSTFTLHIPRVTL